MTGWPYTLPGTGATWSAAVLTTCWPASPSRLRKPVRMLSSGLRPTALFLTPRHWTESSLPFVNTRRWTTAAIPSSARIRWVIDLLGEDEELAAVNRAVPHRHVAKPEHW